MLKYQHHPPPHREILQAPHSSSFGGHSNFLTLENSDSCICVCVFFFFSFSFLGYIVLIDAFLSKGYI